MITILTEKPCVAETIARIVGADQKQAGYFEGPKYYVTWTLGHLISLAPPASYGYPKLTTEQLPLIPSSFKLIIRQHTTPKGPVTDPTAIRQLKIIDEVISKSESIIVATDPGQEGELIFRWLYAYLGYTKPFRRLWISSLTDEAIRDGLAHLRDGHDFDALHAAAECRAKADWLVDLNANQTIANASGLGNNSLGRVLAPTLSMICSRYLDNRSFIPSTGRQLAMTLRKGNALRRFIHSERIGNRTKADEYYKRLGKCLTATITVSVRRKCYQRPPMLYDLTALLQDGCVSLDFTSEQTLDIVQTLYERRLISFPRTGSRHIPESAMATIPALLERIFAQKEFSGLRENIDAKRLPGWNVDKKVTGYHAIIPTGIQPPKSLTEEERQVYRLIVLRMIEAFSPRCEKALSLVEADADGLLFRSRTFQVVRPGWRSICRRDEDRDPDETGEDADTVAEFFVGEDVEIAGWNLGKSHSVPKPLYTEASLLEAMTCPGKDDFAGSKRSVETLGLGTPASRAGIISELFKREYVECSAKKIIPTERGLYLFEALKGTLLTDVSRAEQFENDLARIERQEMEPEHFMQTLSSYVRQLTDEISSTNFTSTASAIACPKCRDGKMILQRKIVKCNCEKCGFVLSRSVLNRLLTDKQIEQLLTDGQTEVIEGFRNKGRKFDAALKLDADFKIMCVSVDRAERER